MLIIVICLLMEKKSLSLKLTITMTIKTFQLNFVSEIYLMDLVLLSLKEVSLNGNVYDVSTD